MYGAVSSFFGESSLEATGAAANFRKTYVKLLVASRSVSVLVVFRLFGGASYSQRCTERQLLASIGRRRSGCDAGIGRPFARWKCRLSSSPQWGRSWIAMVSSFCSAMGAFANFWCTWRVGRFVTCVTGQSYFSRQLWLPSHSVGKHRYATHCYQNAQAPVAWHIAPGFQAACASRQSPPTGRFGVRPFFIERVFNVGMAFALYMPSA